MPPETSLADFAEEVAGEHCGLSRLVRPEDMNAAADHDAAAVAAALLKRPTAKNLIDVQRRYAGRKGTIFAGQAVTHATAQYRTGTR